MCLKIALEDLVRIAHVSAEKISPLRPSAVLSAMAADLWSPRTGSTVLGETEKLRGYGWPRAEKLRPLQQLLG